MIELSSTRIELFNARFADVAHGRYYPHGTRLIIADDKILAMPGLPGQPTDLPTAQRIDLQGRAVLPGLFNTHCHPHINNPTPLMEPLDLWRMWRYTQKQIEHGLADCVQRGITHVRDTLAYDLRANQRLTERIARGELRGPRLYPSVLIAPLGGTFSQPQNWLLELGMKALGMNRPAYHDPHAGGIVVAPNASAAQLRAAVNRAIDERQAHTIKLYDQSETIPFYQPGAQIFNTAQLHAIADEAHRRGRPVTIHHTSVAGFRRGVAAGVTSLAHLPLDAPLSDADLQACQRAGCIIEPTLTIAYFYAWPLPDAPWREHPNQARLAEFRRQTAERVAGEYSIAEWAGTRRRLFAKVGRGQLNLVGVDMRPIYRYWGRMISHGVENLRRLAAAGIPLACGNDLGANPVSEAAIGLELALLNLFLDWTPAEALRCASLHSARALGLQERFGSLEPGKVADLVALDGDPLADPTCLGSPAAAVWMAGQLQTDSMAQLA
jgi:imidazolonepropionase-like amidohydrolase